MAGVAVVIGAKGGIGNALVDGLRAGGRYDNVIALSRSSQPPIDIADEASITAAAAHVGARGDVRLVIIATGVLRAEGVSPEKSWRELDADALARSYAINTIGPALILKHFLPLLPRDGRSIVAALSARVGSIGDNRLGGWYGYRASKAALNQIIRTAAVELARGRPEAICVALHPGTVATPLSAPFMKAGLDIQTPDEAAARLMHVIDGLAPGDTGALFDHLGEAIPW